MDGLYNTIRSLLLQTSPSHTILVQDARHPAVHTVTSRQIYTRVCTHACKYLRLLRIYIARVAIITLRRDHQPPARHFSWMKPLTWMGKKRRKKETMLSETMLSRRYTRKRLLLAGRRFAVMRTSVSFDLASQGRFPPLALEYLFCNSF